MSIIYRRRWRRQRQRNTDRQADIQTDRQTDRPISHQWPPAHPFSVLSGSCDITVTSSKTDNARRNAWNTIQSVLQAGQPRPGAAGNKTLLQLQERHVYGAMRLISAAKITSRVERIYWSGKGLRRTINNRWSFCHDSLGRAISTVSLQRSTKATKSSVIRHFQEWSGKNTAPAR